MKPITNTVELAEKIISEAFKDKKDGQDYILVVVVSGLLLFVNLHRITSTNI